MRLCAALAASLLALAGSPATASPDLQGTWDLQWQTRRGVAPGGYLVISQKGSSFEAELHGRGSIRASGTLNGNSFTLRGSRFFVPYIMTGIVNDDSIEGVLKVRSIERRFVGRRRPVSPAQAKPR